MSDYLMHHGVLGQKWGIRRFQNADGTLTAQGRSRYGDKADKVEKKLQEATKWENKAINAKQLNNAPKDPITIERFCPNLAEIHPEIRINLCDDFR